MKRIVVAATGFRFVHENGKRPGVRLKKQMSHAELTKKIETIDDQLDTMVPGDKPSPERGMQMLERGHKTEVSNKLKQRRRKLEDKA